MTVGGWIQGAKSDSEDAVKMVGEATVQLGAISQGKRERNANRELTRG